MLQEFHFVYWLYEINYERKKMAIMLKLSAIQAI